MSSLSLFVATFIAKQININILSRMLRINANKSLFNKLILTWAALGTHIYKMCSSQCLYVDFRCRCFACSTYNVAFYFFNEFFFVLILMHALWCVNECHLHFRWRFLFSSNWPIFIYTPKYYLCQYNCTRKKFVAKQRYNKLTNGWIKAMNRNKSRLM